jgi:hypothetical protein
VVTVVIAVAIFACSIHPTLHSPWLTNLVKTTRRRLLNSAAALTVLIALAALGSPATAFAQDSTQSKATSHTPEGSWLYTVTIPNPPNAPIVFPGTETYSAGGGYVEADQLSFMPGYLATAGVEEHRKGCVSSDLYEPHL